MFKANKVKSGMAKVSRGDTAPLSGGQSHEIRNMSDRKGRAGKVFSKREKAQLHLSSPKEPEVHR